MASLDSARDPGFFASDAWGWWQARRLRYNLALAIAAWAAYFVMVAESQALGHPVWNSARGALGMTLFLGSAWLVVTGIANLAFLMGPALEAWLKPTDLERYRRTAWGMGFWGSLAVPFIFPTLQLAAILTNAG